MFGMPNVDQELGEFKGTLTEIRDLLRELLDLQREQNQ